MMIYLIEIDEVNAAGIPGMFRYSTGQGFYNGAFFYQPLIIQPGLIQKDIFSGGQIGGESSTSYGEIVIINPTVLPQSLYCQSHEIRLFIGDEHASYAGFTLVMRGIVQDVLTDETTTTIRIKGRQTELRNKPLQNVNYLGNNTLPNGVEGGTDLKEQPKPLLFGLCNNVSPVLINSSRLIYQLSTELTTMVNVYDKGVLITPGADYTSQSDMETNAPSVGTWRQWPAGGMFRLGSSPSGKVTADAHSGTAYATMPTSGELAMDIVHNFGGIASVDTVSTDISAVDGYIPYLSCLFVDQSLSVADALDQVLGGSGAWWGFDQLGRFRMSKLTPPVSIGFYPVGSVVATISDDEILSWNAENVDLSGDSSRVWRVKINYDINWTVQSDSELAGGVTLERKEYLAKASRQASYSDAAIKTYNNMAKEIEIDSVMSYAGNVEAEYRLNFYKSIDAIRTVTVNLTAELLTVIDIGSLVNVFATDWRVVGLQHDFQHNQIQIRLIS